MRRSLVLGDESAHHPFRQSLPPHVCHRPRSALRKAKAPSSRVKAWIKALCKAITPGDVRDFLLAYGACFVAVSAFIA